MPIEEFLHSRSLAVVGVSADEKKFGTKVWRDLRAKGYSVFGVNPHLEQLDGEKIYPNLSSLPEVPKGLILVVPPRISEDIVQEAHMLGIRRIWMQPGAESEKAIRFCRKNQINVIHSQCVMIQALPRRDH